MLTDIDEFMRSFDTKETGKAPEASHGQGIDVLSSTSRTSGRGSTPTSPPWPTPCRPRPRTGIEFIVLDRPNPVNGDDMEGPILEYPEFSSFVGLYPDP